MTDPPGVGAVRSWGPVSTRAALAATLTSGALWGLSGTAAQVLFVRFGFPVLGLLALRGLIAGGVILLRIGTGSRPAFTPGFLAYAFLGILTSQFAYLEAIQLSNAVTATLLQFLFLPMVALYETLVGRIRWSVRWSLLLGLAGVGTALLVVRTTGASLGLLVTPGGLLFGLLAAVAGAYYSVAGARVVAEHGAWPVLGWSSLLGGIVALPFAGLALPRYAHGLPSLSALVVLLLVVFVAVVGTVLAFGPYLSGLPRLPATEVGLAASTEPIFAAVATFVFLGVVLTRTQYAGAALILIAVALLGVYRGSAPLPEPGADAEVARAGERP